MKTFLYGEKQNETLKFTNFTNTHNKRVTKLFNSWCKKDINENLDKRLKDILKEGVEKNKEFFENMLLLRLDIQKSTDIQKELRNVFLLIRHN